MIPQIIHYCWFGGKPLPKLAKLCIASWKRHFPNYEIKEWNERNFDVNIIHYTKEAYEVKRYAFVSDYARFYILYNYGGLYFDVDVEVIRSFEDIICRGNFMGHEANIKDDIPLCVGPGLGMGCEAGDGIIATILEKYTQMHFLNADGTQNLKTVVQHISEILIEYGLKKEQGIQKVGSFWIYPKEYFNPYDCVSEKFFLTDNTRSIHHFSASWKMRKEKFMEWVQKHFGSSMAWTIHQIKEIFTHLFAIR